LAAVVGGSKNGNGNGVVAVKPLSRKDGNERHATTSGHQLKAKAMAHKAPPGLKNDLDGPPEESEDITSKLVTSDQNHLRSLRLAKM